MFTDIQNSIKAKLYDYTYTPFMSSAIIAWVVLNHKYLLIYFGDSKLEDKLFCLDNYDFSIKLFSYDIPYSMNIFIPILFGLFYVFIYPEISKIFYEYTLKRTKELKVIKQSIEDETPITREEARQIREDINSLTLERDELLEQLTSIEKKYRDKYEQELEKNKVPTLDSYKKIAESQSNEDDEMKVLRFLYESNYKPVNERKFLDLVVADTNIARPKAKKIFDKLLQDGVLSLGNSSLKYIHITNNGNDLLLEKFDNGGDNARL